MNKAKTPCSLNQQIRQLQQQMADQQVLQQQQQKTMQDLLLQRLTSWPMLLGAVATGLLLSKVRRQTSPVPAPSPLGSAAGQPAPCDDAPTRTPFWHRLLSLPLLTQSIWWLAGQAWHSPLFRHALRQKLSKSDQRHPKY